jgi:hypothetical protein
MIGTLRVGLALGGLLLVTWGLVLVDPAASAVISGSQCAWFDIDPRRYVAFFGVGGGVLYLGCLGQARRSRL